MTSTWDLLEASERAEKDAEHAVEHLMPFMGADVPEEVLLGDRNAPMWKSVKAPIAKLLCLTAELRHAKTAQDVRQLEDGLNEIHGNIPSGPLYAWADALTDKGRLISKAVGMQTKFSGAHSALLYVCDSLTQQYLVQRDWEHANELLERTNLLDNDMRGMPYQAILCYLYYAGLVYSVQANYDSAIRAWSWLDALRKLILVQLLNNVHTSRDALLRGQNPGLRSQYARQVQPYLSFAESYGRRANSSLTHELLANYRAQFEADANWGLVQRCMAKQPEYWLGNVVKVYTNLPLLAIAHYLDCSEQQAREYLQRHDQINAQYYEAKLTDTTIPLPDGIQYKPDPIENATFVKFCLQPSMLSETFAASESACRLHLVNQLNQASLAPEHLAKLWSLHTSTLEPPP